MSTSDRLLSLIGLIYDAALDPSKWTVFLEAYAAAVGASAAALLFHDANDHRGGIAMAIGVDPESLAKYNEYYGSRDPWILAGEARRLLGPGAVRVGDELISRSEFKKTEYYSDLAKPYELTQVLGGVIRRDHAVLSNISALRPDSRPSFGEHERNLLTTLMPHLQRATQIHGRIGGVELHHAAALDALDRLPLGVILVRGDGRVVFANSASRAVLDRCDGLGSAHGQLTAAAPAENAALQALLRAAAQTARGATDHAAGAVALSRPSLRPPLSVLVTPLRAGPGHPLAQFTGMAAVFVTDPSTASTPTCAYCSGCGA